MKAIVISLLLLGPACLWAASSDESDTVTVRGTSAARDNAIRMRPDNYTPYLNEYDLANGQTLAIYARGLRVYASIGNERGHELEAVASNTFYAADGKLRMTINLDGRGNASGFVYVPVPQQHVALNSGYVAYESIPLK
jgi:hypothetical protein